LAGEFVHLSGHVAVFFSGAFIRHYHMHNVSRASATTFKHLLRTMAFLAENFIFIYLGLSLFACMFYVQVDIGSIIILTQLKLFDPQTRTRSSGSGDSSLGASSCA
jgi:NhaP-type Na+/H+ or K+/H+ antiporter